jgi:thiamine biosynthesis lipoprotein
MNSDVVLAAEGHKAQVERGFDQVQALVAALEVRLTRFADTSELAQLNRSAGSWFRASDELFSVIRQAYDFVSETDGLFDPSILDALESVGYDKSMDEIRAHGVTHSSAPRQNKWDARAIELDADAQAVRLPRGVRLDLGGIAKGWIAECAANQLSQYADACAVSTGGDMFMVGLPTEGTMWSVDLEDPRDRDQALATLHVGPGAVTTSSVMKRRWMQGERVRHHLIDPRSGQPAETDWLSVTVLAPHATTAEVFAKAILIAGSREAERIAGERSDLAFIAVDHAGQLWGSHSAKEFFDVAAEHA